MLYVPFIVESEMFCCVFMELSGNLDHPPNVNFRAPHFFFRISEKNNPAWKSKAALRSSTDLFGSSENINLPNLILFERLGLSLLLSSHDLPVILMFLKVRNASCACYAPEASCLRRA